VASVYKRDKKKFKIRILKSLLISFFWYVLLCVVPKKSDGASQPRYETSATLVSESQLEHEKPSVLAIILQTDGDYFHFCENNTNLHFKTIYSLHPLSYPLQLNSS
jgi:hypothetical protein